MGKVRKILLCAAIIGVLSVFTGCSVENLGEAMREIIKEETAYGSESGAFEEAQIPDADFLHSENGNDGPDGAAEEVPEGNAQTPGTENAAQPADDEKDTRGASSAEEPSAESGQPDAGDPTGNAPGTADGVLKEEDSLESGAPSDAPAGTSSGPDAEGPADEAGGNSGTSAGTDGAPEADRGDPAGSGAKPDKNAKPGENAKPDENEKPGGSAKPDEITKPNGNAKPDASGEKPGEQSDTSGGTEEKAGGAGSDEPKDTAGTPSQEDELFAEPEERPSNGLFGDFDLMEEVQAQSDRTESGTALKGKVVCLILPGEDELSETEAEVFRNRLESAGGTVELFFHGGDAELEAEAFESAVRMRADLIICDNVDQKTTRACVQSAKDAGVVTFLLNKGIDVTGIAKAQFLTEQYSLMDALADAVGELLFPAEDGAEAEEPSGAAATAQPAERAAVDCLLLGGAVSDGRAADLTDAFLRRFRRTDGLNSVLTCAPQSYEEADTRKGIDRLLTEAAASGRYGNGSGAKAPGGLVLVCYNEAQTLTALEYLSEKNRTDVKVACICGDGASLAEKIKSGEVLAATAKPAERLADEAADLAFRYLRLGTVDGIERRYVNAEILRADDAELLSADSAQE